MTSVAMLRWKQSEAELSLKEIKQNKPVRTTELLCAKPCGFIAQGSPLL